MRLMRTLKATRHGKKDSEVKEDPARGRTDETPLFRRKKDPVRGLCSQVRGSSCGRGGGRKRRQRDKLVRVLVLILQDSLCQSAKFATILTGTQVKTSERKRGEKRKNETHHVERDDATLPDDPRDVFSLGKLFQDGEALARRDASERFGSFVTDHVFLVRSPEDVDQGRDGIGRRQLAEHERNLVAGVAIDLIRESQLPGSACII